MVVHCARLVFYIYINSFLSSFSTPGVALIQRHTAIECLHSAATNCFTSRYISHSWSVFLLLYYTCTTFRVFCFSLGGIFFYFRVTGACPATTDLFYASEFENNNKPWRAKRSPHVTISLFCLFIQSMIFALFLPLSPSLNETQTQGH